MSNFHQWKLDGTDLEDRLAIYEIVPKNVKNLTVKEAAQLLDRNIHYVLSDSLQNPGYHMIQISSNASGKQWIVGFPKNGFVEVSRTEDRVSVVSNSGTEVWRSYEIELDPYYRNISRRFEMLKLREINLKRQSKIGKLPLQPKPCPVCGVMNKSSKTSFYCKDHRGSNEAE